MTDTRRRSRWDLPNIGRRLHELLNRRSRLRRQPLISSLGDRPGPIQTPLGSNHNPLSQITQNRVLPAPENSPKHSSPPRPEPSPKSPHPATTNANDPAGSAPHPPTTNDTDDAPDWRYSPQYVNPAPTCARTPQTRRSTCLNKPDSRQEHVPRQRLLVLLARKIRR